MPFQLLFSLLVGCAIRNTSAEILVSAGAVFDPKAKGYKQRGDVFGTVLTIQAGGIITTDAKEGCPPDMTHCEEREANFVNSSLQIFAFARFMEPSRVGGKLRYKTQLERVTPNKTLPGVVAGLILHSPNCQPPPPHVRAQATVDFLCVLGSLRHHVRIKYEMKQGRGGLLTTPIRHQQVAVPFRYFGWRPAETNAVGRTESPSRRLKSLLESDVPPTEDVFGVLKMPANLAAPDAAGKPRAVEIRHSIKHGYFRLNLEGPGTEILANSGDEAFMHKRGFFKYDGTQMRGGASIPAFMFVHISRLRAPEDPPVGPLRDFFQYGPRLPGCEAGAAPPRPSGMGFSEYKFLDDRPKQTA